MQNKFCSFGKLGNGLGICQVALNKVNARGNIGLFARRQIVNAYDFKPFSRHARGNS